MLIAQIQDFDIWNIWMKTCAVNETPNEYQYFPYMFLMWLFFIVK